MLSYHQITDNIIGLQGLNLDEVMPTLCAYLIAKGKMYKTGSDYTPEQLAAEILECQRCDGKGMYPFASSPDDYDWAECDACGMTGKYSHIELNQI